MKGIKLTACLLTAVLIFLLATPQFTELGINRTQVKAEDEAEWEEEGGGGSGSPGSGGEGFTVLEIVPYVGNQEIGYLVGGEEPVERDLLNWYDIGAVRSLTQNAVDYYLSYVDISMNPSGTYDKTANTMTYQSGYFEKQSSGGAGLYAISSGESYIYVGSGKGNYKAALDTQESTDFYSTFAPGNPMMNQKNVKAYFVQNSTIAPLMPGNTRTYYPASVTERTDNGGDYDYNPGNESFILNKGHGDYDVLFSTQSNDYNSSGAYYMAADYTIVADNSGSYSWNLKYTDVGVGNGSYLRIPYTINYQKDWGGDYRWYPSSTTPGNSQYNSKGYYVENAGQANEKIWIKNQSILSQYKYLFYVQMVNNEWFKRFALNIDADKARDYKVDVIAMTPKELNKEENRHYVTEADFFYINNEPSNSDYIRFYETYSRAGIAAKAAGGNSMSFEQNDLSWDNVETIFKRAAGVSGTRPAIIMSDDIYQKAFSYGGYKKNVTVYDYQDNTTSDTGTTHNIAKLYLMLMQRDTRDFYDAFMNPDNPSPYKIKKVNVDTSISQSGSTGSFVRPDSGMSILNTDKTYKTEPYKNDAALYWNQNTFVPLDIEDNGKMIKYLASWKWDSSYLPRSTPMDDGTKLWGIREGEAALGADTKDTVIYYKRINGYNDVATYIPNHNLGAGGWAKLNDNVYVKDGPAIFHGSSFLNGGTISNYQEAADSINAYRYANNLSPSTSFTIADIINYITNNGQGYGGTGSDSGSTSSSVIRVLNIQPTADFGASVENIHKIVTGYTKIENVTSTQFNAKINDINTDYDLIYIGKGVGRFNKDSGGNTAFNLSAHNGKFYMNPGDSISIATGVVKDFTGNDITATKKHELLDFLSAGYPVVLEKELYQYSSSEKLATASILKSFIDTAKLNAAYRILNMEDYNSTNASTKYAFLGKIISGLSVIKPDILLKEPILGSTSVNYKNLSDYLLKVRYQLLPHGSAAGTYRYNTYLYVDKNGDGLFTESEKIALTSSSSNSTNLEESTDKIYTYRYNMSGKNGGYQWKLLAERADNTHIRSETRGYISVTNRKTVKILQIIDNEGSDGYTSANRMNYSLKAASQTVNNKIWEYGGFATGKELSDYVLDFTTMTVSEFLSLYSAAGKNYTSATASTTNQLTGYSLLVVDNQVNQINDSRGALSNIKDEIGKGMSVLFTKGSVTAATQGIYLNSADYIFDSILTYERLSELGTAYQTNQYNLYDFVPGSQWDGHLNYNTTYITRANGGAVGEYPYAIGNHISIASQGYNIDTVFDFNRLDTAPLVGWYCLSDAKSPVVKPAETNPYSGIYSSAPNDVKNNYYLINKGRIFYSGIQLSSAITADNADEIKLFINTLIAVYNASGKTSSAPVVQILDPLPDSGTIRLSHSDLEGKAEYPIVFEISGSSSNVSVNLDWDDNSNVTGSWNQTLYSVAGDGSLTLVADRNNLPAGTYAVKIPRSDLPGTHSLVITAQNQTGQVGTTAATVIYTFEPPTIQIDNPELIYKSSTERYLYVSLDQSAMEGRDENAYLNSVDPIMIHFTLTVPNVGDTCLIQVLNSDGVEIGIFENRIYADSAVEGEEDPFYNIATRVSEGRYYVLVPASIMNSLSSKDITVKAILSEEEGGYATDTVTLLRQSLFPLD